MENKNFNIIISGVGGQGLITLVKIILEAASANGKDVKSSELHGLSQRGGSVLTHVRFGEKIFSPLVQEGRADLIIGLEILEGLRSLNFSNKQTIILINDYLSPILGGMSVEQVKEKIKKVAGKNLFLLPASEVCKEKLGKEVVSGVYLLGVSMQKGLIPLEKEDMIEAIKKIIPEKYLELNLKAFELAFLKSI